MTRIKPRVAKKRPAKNSTKAKAAPVIAPPSAAVNSNPPMTTLDRLPASVGSALSRAGQTGRFYLVTAWIENGKIEMRREKRDFPAADEKLLLDMIARDMKLPSVITPSITPAVATNGAKS